MARCLPSLLLRPSTDAPASQASELLRTIAHTHTDVSAGRSRAVFSARRMHTASCFSLRCSSWQNAFLRTCSTSTPRRASPMNRSHGRSPAGALLHACSLLSTALSPCPRPSIASFPVVRPCVALKYYRLSIRLPESSPAGCRDHTSRPSASSRRLRPHPTPALARPARLCAGTAQTAFKIGLLQLQVRRTVHLTRRQLLASSSSLVAFLLVAGARRSVRDDVVVGDRY